MNDTLTSEPSGDPRPGALSPGGIDTFLRRMGAEQLPHGNRRSLHEHLLGTQAILRRWSQPEWVCNAGGLHSVYGTDIYRRQLVPIARRREVQALVGHRAERLIELFAGVSRRDLFRQLDACGRVPAEGLRVERHEDPTGPAEQLSAEEILSLIVLYMANLAEQTCAQDGGPGLWLASLSRMGATLAASGAPVPPMLSGCRRIVSPEDESAAREAYLAGLSAMSVDRSAALRDMSRAAETCPWIAEPAVWLAYLRLQQGEVAEARRWIESAREISSQWGVAWDKRLSFEQWSSLMGLLARPASDPSDLGPLPAPDVQDLTSFVDQLQRRSWVRVQLGSPAPDDEPDPTVAALLAGQGDARLRRFYRYVTSFAYPDGASSIRAYPGLRAQPWHDPEDFALARALEGEYAQIRREISALDGRQFSRESEGIPRTGDWKVLFFNERGRWHEDLAARCPVTSRILEAHGAIRTLAGLCYVSRLAPGTHVTAHHGPTNLRVRCHLGIQVPGGNCGIRVDGRARRWEEGKCLVFDDSFLHEAWNHTAGDRVVLVVDLWHPDLTEQEVILLEGLHRYAASQGASLSSYWSANAVARSDSEEREPGPLARR
jgi:aspartyl/asparaginyl beta-hydroxylase (cupin superfamily)